MREIIKAIIVIALVFVSASDAFAEAVVSNLKISYTADASEESLVPSPAEEASADHVELISDGVWDSGNRSLIISPSQTLTVKAEEFGNICKVSLLAYMVDDTADMTCTIVSATGPEIDGLESLGDDTSIVGDVLEIQGEDIIRWIFELKTGVRLSEITFQFKADTYLYKVIEELDVTPVLPTEEIRLYGEDKIPFFKRSNCVPYCYSISSDTDDIQNDMYLDEEFTESFKAVPDDGISLAGHPNGKYVVYVSADADNYSVYPDLKHVIVNYMAKSPSTGLESVEDTAVREYYDLYGRKLIRPIEGLQILKDKRTGSAKIIRL